MTNDELTELERLAAEATPGSWKGDEGIAHWGADGYNLRPANAAFIAAARTAVPALIASLREARSEQRLAVDNASVLMRQRSDAMQASDEMARINSALRAEVNQYTANTVEEFLQLCNAVDALLAAERETGSKDGV